MSRSTRTLIAGDQPLARDMETYWKNTFREPAWVCPFEAVPNYLGPQTDGLLFLAAAREGDVAPAWQLVQGICLQKWPPATFLVTSEATSSCRDLIALDLWLMGRFRWPEEAAGLVERVFERLGRTGGRAVPDGTESALLGQADFRDPSDDSLPEAIARRLLCQTPSFLPMVERLSLAASHDVTVLLTGETGTGKTHLARLIHDCSPRRRERFLVVPCGALAPNLIESEFFGHSRGAFTGADRAKVGKFAAVGGGTLFLDEIDSLGLEQQANLLRVIETGEFEPVGSNQTQVCRARLLVAGSSNLEQAVERGAFRRDLYYRLNVMAFHLQPLRQRTEDIIPLVRALTARFAAKFHKALFDVHPAVLQVLEAFRWPGNIRQLENVIQRAVLVSTGSQLLLQHLPASLQEYASVALGQGHTLLDSLAGRREAEERAIIQRALANSGYSRVGAASALGISRVTLYKKMKKYGLMELPARDAEEGGHDRPAGSAARGPEFTAPNGLAGGEGQPAPGH